VKKPGQHRPDCVQAYSEADPPGHGAGDSLPLFSDVRYVAFHSSLNFQGFPDDVPRFYLVDLEIGNAPALCRIASRHSNQTAILRMLSASSSRIRPMQSGNAVETTARRDVGGSG